MKLATWSSEFFSGASWLYLKKAAGLLSSCPHSLAFFVYQQVVFPQISLHSPIEFILSISQTNVWENLFKGRRSWMSYFDNEGYWVIFQALYLCYIDDWAVRKQLDPTQWELKFYYLANWLDQHQLLLYGWIINYFHGRVKLRRWLFECWQRQSPAMYHATVLW